MRIKTTLFVVVVGCAITACASPMSLKASAAGSSDNVVATPTPLPPPPRSSEPTELICDFLVMHALVPPGSTGVCQNEVMPVLFTHWNQEQTYRYYVDLARSKRWDLVTEYVPKPVSHSVPISYYEYRFNITGDYRIYNIELYPAAGGTGIRIRTTSRFGGISGNGPRSAPKSRFPPPPYYYANTNVPLDALFSRFITPLRALQIAQSAILADAPKGYRAEPYWVALERMSGSVYAWDVRTSDGPMYPKPTLVHFAMVNALTGAIISVRAEPNAPSLPIPPNPPPALSAPMSTPVPRQPGNATEPISNFEKAFHDLLDIAISPHAPGEMYVTEVKLLPYGVAREYYKPSAIAPGVDSARMYLVRTLVYPHGLNTSTCSYLYAAVTTMYDAATGARGSDQIEAACDPKHIYNTSQPAPIVRSYSVYDIGRPGAPKLTPDQRSLVNRILAKLPTAKRNRIRFVFSGAEAGPKTNFYVLDPGTAPPTGIVGGNIQTFRVLNGACNLFYDPVRDYVFAGTSCGLDPDVTG